MDVPLLERLRATPINPIMMGRGSLMGVAAARQSRLGTASLLAASRPSAWWPALSLRSVRGGKSVAPYSIHFPSVASGRTSRSACNIRPGSSTNGRCAECSNQTSLFSGALTCANQSAAIGPGVV